MSNRLTSEQIRRQLWAARWAAYGQEPSLADENYWVPMWNDLNDHGEIEMRPPVYNYAKKRAMGWQATGADVATYGDYAQPPTAGHAIPPYPGDEPFEVPSPVAQPPFVAQPPEAEPVLPMSVMDDVLTQLAAIKATTDLTLLAVQGQSARIEQIRSEVVQLFESEVGQSFISRLFGR